MGVMMFCFVLMLVLSHSASAASTIAGTVYDKQRNPLSDIEVELLDDYYRSVGRARTNGSGRYQFTGLNDGRYTVKVYAFRYDLEDQEFPVEILTQNLRGGQGSGYFTQDFYLSPKKGGLRDSELKVIFVQEIPKEARLLYERALDGFADKKDEQAFVDLRKSLELFPTYYAALHRFGVELFTRKQYLDASAVFIRAAQVNPKSATSLYFLANALHNAGKQYDKAALAAIEAAYTLAPSSVQVLWLMGKIQRSMGDLIGAEKNLLLAKKLSVARVAEIHKELAQLYANDLKKFGEAAAELELYLKAGKLPPEEEKKTRRLIEDLRKKAGRTE
jgi:hypothetical protein